MGETPNAVFLNHSQSSVIRGRPGRIWSTATALLLLGAMGAASPGEPKGVAEQGQQQSQRDEERQDYFAKWLREDVTYIITQAERDVFDKLTTEEEKTQFIEQFWYRRDPDLRTPSNEFKAEHYRRIAYANERFTSGVPGWKTDRGRLYIIHGPPVEIEKHYSGESYERPAHEGGGFTSVLPFEIWRYRYIEGIGPDVEIEFVDPTRSGEFRLARTPWEKDEMLFVPGAAPTIAESLGLMERGDHPYFTTTNADRYPGMKYRAQDNPFTRYERLVRIQSPQQLKYRDLKEIVEVDIQFDALPFQTRHDYFQLNEGAVLAAVSLELENRDLTFQQEDGQWVARIALYGIVTSLSNRVVSEFDQELMISYSNQAIATGREGRSVYQKILPLERRTRYRLDLVVKDLNSEKTGVRRKAIIPPPFKEKELWGSSLLLSDHIVPVEDPGQLDQIFVIGDVKVRPNLRQTFAAGEPLGAYLQVYNAALDQTSLRPDLPIRYEVLTGDQIVRRGTLAAGRGMQYFSNDRVVLILNLPVQSLPAGDYQLRLEIQDRVSSQTLNLQEHFRLEQEQS